MLFYPNSICQKCLFIESGLLRGYKIVDGKEFTHHFYSEKWFATDYKSFLTEQPSDLYIETLAETHYYEFDKKALLKLYADHQPFEKLGRIMAEKAYLSTVDKLADIQTFDLKDRYQRLVIKNPKLFQSVPQKHIASYLGVSEQSLSRIKSSFFS